MTSISLCDMMYSQRAHEWVPMVLSCQCCCPWQHPSMHNSCAHLIAYLHHYVCMNGNRFYELGDRFGSPNLSLDLWGSLTRFCVAIESHSVRSDNSLVCVNMMKVFCVRVSLFWLLVLQFWAARNPHLSTPNNLYTFSSHTI
jgi:hypothetical protein